MTATLATPRTVEATPTGTSPSKTRRYLHGVQGLRTVAALMVAVYHIWFQRVSGGVDVFFVVAGFFAAGSLLRITTPTSTRAWFAGSGQYLLRTARRVIPSAAVVVVGTVAAGFLFLPKSHWPYAVEHGTASLLFRENWHLIDVGADYLQQGLASSPFQQFWALSIQVQAYVTFVVLTLVAAWIARFLRASKRRTLFLVSIAVGAASLIASIQMTATDQPVAYFHLSTRLWEFMAGVIVALAVTKAPVRVGALRYLGWAGLIAMVGFAAVYDPSTLLPGYVALIPVGAGLAIIVTSTAGAEPVILKWKPILWFADSSFAFYLWHWPILVYYRWEFGESVGLKAGLAIILLSAILAVLTTKLVESPVRTWRRLVVSPPLSIVVSAALLVPAGGALMWWQQRYDAGIEADWDAVAAILDQRSLPAGQFAPSTAIAHLDKVSAYELGCQNGTKDATVKVCEWGDPDADEVVLMWGASHDTQWIDALDLAGQEMGFRLRTITKGSCAMGDMTSPDIDFKMHASCPPWSEAALATILNDPPDLVVSTVTSGMGGRERYPVWKTAVVEKLTGAGIPVLGLRDNPWFGSRVPDCIDKRGVDGCDVLRDKALLPVEELGIPEMPLFTFLDTANDFCDETVCRAVQGGVLMSWDGSHLTRTWTLMNDGTLRAAIAAQLDAP